MTTLEKKISDYINDHLEWLLVFIGVICSLAIRFFLRDYESADMSGFLLPWYETMKNMEAGSRLSVQIGDYNLLYQIFISIATLLPIKPIYAYKIFSIIFDYSLGGIIAGIVWQTTGKNKLKTAIAFVISINLPMVFLNSAMWGQCDSIYVFFCLLAFLLFAKQKSTFAFVAYGAACAFKLQAVFMLPFIIYIYLKEKNFSLWKFFLIPVMMMILSLPAVIQGRSILDCFSVYLNQTRIYNYNSMNYPGFWIMVLPNKSDAFFGYMKYPSILLTFIILLIELVWFLKSKNESVSRWVNICFLMAYTCVLFLPSMHERYDYLPVMMGLILSFIEPKSIILFVSLCIVNLLAYSDFLFSASIDWRLLSIINVLVFTGYMLLFAKKLESKGIE